MRVEQTTGLFRRAISPPRSSAASCRGRRVWASLPRLLL